ncbi:MAG TPA: TPM domain-containing protein [Pyrinomonadaceae bacterium]|nr:TPM domain-containing protein [Pyrinomonadaceae bacterium]
MRKAIAIASLFLCIFVAASCSKPGAPVNADDKTLLVSPAGNTAPTRATGSGKAVVSAIDDVTTNSGGQTKSPLPPPTGFVNDFADVIDAKTKKGLETSLKKLRTESDIEFAVVTVDTTGEQSSVDYAMAVARGWGVGSKNKDGGGLLLLIAIRDRKWELRWTHSLEDDLQDGIREELARRMTGLFLQHKYSEGIANGVKAVMLRLEGHRPAALPK